MERVRKNKHLSTFQNHNFRHFIAVFAMKSIFKDAETDQSTLPDSITDDLSGIATELVL